VTTLNALVAAELAEPVDPRIVEFSRHIAETIGDATRAVLFYGSCLRTTELEGQMLDFYVIVSDYRAAYTSRWLAAANRLLPPNVFPIQWQGLQAKYAVLSEADFARLASSSTRNVSVWARFAQPARLAWVADDMAREAAVSAVSGASPALLAAARPMVDERTDPLALWQSAFALTYRAELRAERGGRAASVVEFDPERYRRFTEPALAHAGIAAQVKPDGTIRFLDTPSRLAGKWRWMRRRFEGKMLTLARLAKASATYAGGIDYLAWKINRHAGTAIAVRPWQRRWPLLGALALLPRLLIRGAVR
jgi:hypothetical protein